ncbi:magnesium transporter [Klebsiella pneumoniae]|uniref:magnesium transporter n=1 Tax=Klebsiella pneumoniae TaxID=573 RepID=UPI0021533907|nr:magnesium transporter [Klebsiella pneumoniae]HBZ8036544.1 magnesium transporter [Klebsiella pneumoniae]
MSVLHKKSARLRDEERARLIWLLSTDKAVTSALLGKLTLAERYDEGTLADDLAEVEMLVSHLPPPDLADALEALPYDARTALWCLVPDDKRGEVLLEASENVWGDLIDKMSDPELLQAMQPLDIDEQVYLLQHLPRNLTGRLLATLPAEKRARIISQLVALASLMPIVAGIGGNTGNQTITMIVRAMALQQIQPGSFTFLILREMGVALINGLVWGGIMGAITWWLYDDPQLGGVMTLAMMLNLLMAAMMGVIIPMVMVKLGRDPAVGSSVMITAITDTGGFFIFLGLATLFLM